MLVGLHVHVPTNFQITDKTRKPWVTLAIVKSINKKHKLYKAYKAANFDEIHAAKYREYRNILGTVFKNAKRMYYSNLFHAENKNDTSKTWKTVNELLNGGNVSKMNTEVDKLRTNTDGVRRIVTIQRKI